MVSPAASLCLALYEPDIAQNTGAMLRTCACLGVRAAIIEPAGFPVSDRHFRRSGMDYLDHVAIDRHVSWRAFSQWRHASGRRLILLTTGAEQTLWDFAFQREDILMVGRESAGAPQEVHDDADARVRIAIQPAMRSLNVSVAAGIALGEALRQIMRGGATG
jgi:tRNA (cytidine/uridine-2'-O-)-methyltransferase